MSTSITAQLTRTKRLILGGAAALALGAALGAGAMQAHVSQDHVLVSQKCWNDGEYMCLASHPFGDRHYAAPGVHETVVAADMCFNPIRSSHELCTGGGGHVGPPVVPGVGTGGSGGSVDDSPGMCFDPTLPGMSWCSGSYGHLPPGQRAFSTGSGGTVGPPVPAGVGRGGSGGSANHDDPYCMNGNPIRIPRCGTVTGGNVPS